MWHGKNKPAAGWFIKRPPGCPIPAISTGAKRAPSANPSAAGSETNTHSITSPSAPSATYIRNRASVLPSPGTTTGSANRGAPDGRAYPPAPAAANRWENPGFPPLCRPPQGRGDDAIAHHRYRPRPIEAALRAKDPSGANEQIVFGHIPLLLSHVYITISPAGSQLVGRAEVRYFLRRPWSTTCKAKRCAASFRS